MDILHFIEFAFIVIVGWTLSAMVLPRISLVSFRRRLFDSEMCIRDRDKDDFYHKEECPEEESYDCSR